MVFRRKQYKKQQQQRQQQQQKQTPRQGRIQTKNKHGLKINKLENEEVILKTMTSINKMIEGSEN